MANIFTLENIDNFSEKISIDELYEKKRQQDLTKLALFNKILNRIHVKIKTASRQKVDEQFCWYVVPETMIGVPKYDQAGCIAYIIDKLKTNGFNVRYIHPNLLFISWLHWIPSYVRSELKKKTGIEINEFGEKVAESNNNPNNNNTIVPSINARPTSIYSSAIANAPPNDTLMLNMHSNNDPKEKVKKEYTPIKNYKPSGNLIYDDNLLPK
jgi:hypothetical protein